MTRRLTIFGSVAVVLLALGLILARFVRTGDGVLFLKTTGPVETLASNGKRLHALTREGQLTSWDWANLSAEPHIRDLGDVNAAAMTIDGFVVALPLSSRPMGRFCIWDPDQRLACELLKGDEWLGDQIAASRNGEFTAALFGENWVRTGNHDRIAWRAAVISRNSPTAPAWIPPVYSKTPSVGRMAISENGKYLAMPGVPTPSDLTLLDVNAGKILWSISTEECGLAQAAFSLDGNAIFTGGGMGNVIEVARTDGAIKSKWPSNPKLAPVYGYHVECVAVSPDGRFVAAGTSPRGDIVVWETRNGNRAAFFPGRITITRLIFSPDSSSLAATTGNAGVMVMRLPTDG
ncbi:MAG: hypothetical protein BWX88_05161 [Planctomycetes bacterium ADurb.Bin126]|nr:MAG: hypothetical protein BWX88_05161 [Planctomycetes bacterium ADurb.Bin126]